MILKRRRSNQIRKLHRWINMTDHESAVDEPHPAIRDQVKIMSLRPNLFSEKRINWVQVFRFASHKKITTIKSILDARSSKVVRKSVFTDIVFLQFLLCTVRRMDELRVY